LIHWPVPTLCNTVYALLAERADALDLAEVSLYAADFKKEDREALCGHRESLDRWLDEPMGRQAEAEAALLRALRG
jgi:hypothetical protein